MFSLAYVCACAYAYAYAYVLVKTSPYINEMNKYQPFY